MKSEKKYHSKREHQNPNQKNDLGVIAFAKQEGDRSQKDNKHVLKKKIVKILRKRRQVSFDELIHKLDIAPSRLFKVLNKLERRGIVAQKGRKQHSAGKDFDSTSADKARQHKRKRLEKVCRKIARHGVPEERHGIRKEHGRHHHQAAKEGYERCGNHHTERKSHWKRHRQSARSPQFVLTAAV